jgi:hypothetical protein
MAGCAQAPVSIESARTVTFGLRILSISSNVPSRVHLLMTLALKEKCRRGTLRSRS